MKTMTMNLPTSSLPEFPETSRWIWLPEQQFPQQQLSPVSFYADRHGFACGGAVFVRCFELPEDFRGCRLLVTGDCKYRLFVNDEIFCDGPPEVGGDYGNTEAPDWFFYEIRTVAAPFRSGTNRITAEVMLQGDSQCDYSCGHGGFRLALLDAAGKPLLVTDDSWRCRFDSGWCGDGRYFPAVEPFPWFAAECLTPETARRWRLRPYPLPPAASSELFPVEIREVNDDARLEQREEFLRREAPLLIRSGTPATFLVRFPTEVAGCVEFEMDSAPGARLVCRYQEVAGNTHASEEYCSNGGRVRFRFRGVQAVLWLEVTVHFATFGYAGYGDVRLHKLSVFRQGFPLGEAAPFHSDNPDYLAVRKCCENTLRLCMQRLHWDSPVHKEGLGCLGDYRIQALQSYYLFGESRLMRLDLIRIALLLRQKQRLLFHAGFNALYPVMLREYILYSGDLGILDEPEILPAVDLVLRLLEACQDDTGMLTRADNYMFVDWCVIDGCNFHHPDAVNGAAALTAFYAMALEAAAALAKWRNDPRQEQQRREAWSRIRRNFHTLCFDRGRRCYRNGPEAPTGAPQTGILAIRAGLAPENTARQIIDGLCDAAAAHRIQPYFCDYLFDALAVTGAYERRGAGVLALWNELVAEHPESLKESWECGDYSHSWGGTPAIQFGKRILGVEPEAPGFAECRIAPVTCGLRHAAGAVPTPHGAIEVAWERDGNDFRLVVRHPEAVKVTVIAPESSTSRVECNGIPVLLEK